MLEVMDEPTQNGKELEIKQWLYCHNIKDY
jgi:hypothetical protein